MPDINQKLTILYDLLVDNYDVLTQELIDLISKPDLIQNTNKFASLLSELKNPAFVDPLLLKISIANKGDIWLSDFLYAAIKLLDEAWEDDEFNIPSKFMDKLETWILDNKGELSWKAASLLKFNDSERAEEIQLKKLEERGDFFLTYVECIQGLLRFDKDKHLPLVKQIADDESRDNKLREFAADAATNYR